MVVLDMADFADGGLIREESFRKKVNELDLDSFQNQRVFIKGCAEMIIPTWAFMMLAAHASQTAKAVTFGELKSQTVVFDREG